MTTSFIEIRERRNGWRVTLPSREEIVIPSARAADKFAQEWIAKNAYCRTFTIEWFTYTEIGRRVVDLLTFAHGGTPHD